MVGWRQWPLADPVELRQRRNGLLCGERQARALQRHGTAIGLRRGQIEQVFGVRFVAACARGACGGKQRRQAHP